MIMGKIKGFFFLHAVLLAMSLLTIEVSGCKKKHELGHRKLFVFGDSYADTGNLGNLGSFTRCWIEPYGMTFPKKPSGRFSDGRIYTDYLAGFLRDKSPIPYKLRRVRSHHPYGMNFAVGGTGVYDLGNFQRDLPDQIDTFQGQIDGGVFSEHDVKSSVAYISIAGNDYTFFLQSHSFQEIFGFIDNVTTQLVADMRRLGEIGVGKVVAANLSPLECTPELTRNASNYTKCDARYAPGTAHHNELLKTKVEELNKESNSTEFLVLDLYSAFISVLRPANGASKFKHTLRPCCEAKTADLSCGLVGQNGEKQYSVCGDPEDYFYFDVVHPTQAAWKAVFEATLAWLRQNL